MRTLFSIMIMSLFSIHQSFSQMVNQDADGKSSIVVGGSSINLDIKESLIKAGYYKIPLKASGIAWGIDIQGKNAEGIAGIFESGELSPGGELSGLFGWKHTNSASTFKILIYSRATFQGSQFKYDKGNSFTTIKSRFVDTVHMRAKFELGASMRLGNHILMGVLVGTSKENNQSTLAKSVYKYAVSDTTLPGLQQTKDITAYSGNYGTYTNTFVYFDAVYFHVLNETNYLCPALYFRNNISGNKSLKKNNGVLGVSLNFLNVATAKFLGGIYLQNNDLFNEQDIRIGKRVDFGLIARFTFDTIRL
jgi:hypothetical protein